MSAAFGPTPSLGSRPRPSKPNLVLFALAVGGALLFAGCTSPGGDEEESVLVEMQSPNRFDPETVEVAPGTTVVWVNRDSVAHNTVADNGDWESDLLRGGQQFEHTFDEPGIYTYHCEPHSFQNDDGEWQGMVGTIIVLNEDGSQPSGDGTEGGDQGGNEAGNNTGNETA